MGSRNSSDGMTHFDGDFHGGGTAWSVSRSARTGQFRAASFLIVWTQHSRAPSAHPDRCDPAHVGRGSVASETPAEMGGKDLPRGVSALKGEGPASEPSLPAW